MVYMISSFFGMNSLPREALLVGPEKLFVVVTKPEDEKAKKWLAEKVPLLKEKLKGMVPFEFVETDPVDVVRITSDFLGVLRANPKKRFVIHVTEGRKLLFLGGIFAASLARDQVDGAFYYVQEKDELLRLPLVTFSLSEVKRKILKQVEAGERNVKTIARKCGKHYSLIYTYLRQLKEEGFIAKDGKELRLTDSGRVALL